MANLDKNSYFRYFQFFIGFLLIFFLLRLLLLEEISHSPARHAEVKSGNVKPIRISKDSDVDEDLLGPPQPAQPIPQPCLDFDLNYVEENLLTLDQKDPQLIKYSRIKYLTPPPKLPYNMSGEGIKRSEHNAWVLDFFGKAKRDGIFIEAGANEGAGKSSHTFMFEKEQGWTGLLVECNPKLIPSLKSRRRKAWIGSVCLAPTSTPGVLNFSNPTGWSYSGTFRKPWNIPKKVKWEFFDVETLPLYTLLAALGWKEIDFFLFDIEGMELPVLKVFPFNEIIFKVLIVEVYFYNKSELQELDQLLKSNGYYFVKKIDIDHVYVHNSVKHMLKEK